MKAKQVITPSLASIASTDSSATSTLRQQRSSSSPVKETELGHSSSPQSRNIHTSLVTQQDIQITPKRSMTKTQSSGAPSMSMIIFSPSPLSTLVSNMLLNLQAHQILKHRP